MVTYTNRSAFLSPLAVVVISAIGLAAVLLQLRFRRDLTNAVHAPVWLNVLGVLFALPALFADFLRLGSQFSELMALGAVLAVVGAILKFAIRKHRTVSK